MRAGAKLQRGPASFEKPPMLDGSPDLADALLLRYRSKRNADDLGRLFDAVAPALFRLAVRITHDGAVAEDVVQETFLAVLGSVDDWDPRRAAMAWLTGILHRKAADAWRVRTRDRRAVPRSSAVEDPTAGAERHEELALVRAAIDDLDEPYRRVAALRWRYGLEPGEIADALDENPASIRSLLHRAKAKLEGRLRPALAPAVFAVPSSRGLVAVRATVVAAAQASAPATAATTLLTLGGIAMAQKLLVTTVALLALAAGVALIADRPDRGVESDPVRRADARSPVPHDDGLPAGPSLPAPADLAKVDRDLDLHGRVTDATGKPIAGARLLVVHDPWRRAPTFLPNGDDMSVRSAELFSAEDGTFALRLPRGAQRDLTVEADGFVTRSRPRVQAGERVDIALVRIEDGAELMVTVVDARGAAVPGASVQLRSNDRALFDRSEMTSAEGRARFSGVPTAFEDLGASPQWTNLYLSVAADGHGSTSVEIPLPERGLHERTIALPEPHPVRGTATDADTGRPISGARVGLGWTQESSVLTDDQGQ